MTGRNAELPGLQSNAGFILKKISYLEGLRGIACFMVVLSHFAVSFFPALYYGLAPEAHYPRIEIFIANSPLNILYSGNLAVCIFFILSGYVLSHKFFVCQDRNIALSGMIKRYVRLVIPVAAAMLILYAFIAAKMLYNEAVASYTKSELLLVVFTAGVPTLKDIIRQSFINSFFTGGTVYDHVLWTMRYELYGSYMVFIFMLLIGLSRYRVIAYGLLAVFFWDSYYEGFVIGMFLADITASKDFGKKLRIPFFVKIVLLTAAILAGSYPMGVKQPVGLYRLITFSSQALSAQVYHMLAAAIILFFALTESRVQSSLESAVPSFLGKISFSLYLLHWIVVFSFSSFLVLFLRDLGIAYPLNIALVCCASVPVMFAASWPFYKYVDRQSMRLANAFSRFVMERLGRAAAVRRCKSAASRMPGGPN